MGYRIQVARSFAAPGDIWCSTDSEAYAETARSLGAEVPFLRPPELATDTASSADVILHAMDHAERLGRNYDMVGLLEPTSPFIYNTDILGAVRKLAGRDDADAIVAVRESRPNRLFVQGDREFLDEIAQNIGKLQQFGRQLLGKEITPSGGFYISKWEAFKRNKGFYTERTMGWEVPWESELEIDEPADWMWAEFLIGKGIVHIDKLIR